MKTISEVASLLDITPQAIYRYIKQDIVEGLSDHIHKNNSGVTVIDNRGLELIKDHLMPFKQEFKHDFKDEHSEEIRQLKEEVTENYIDDLKKHIEVLEEQLKIKDSQINVKDEQINQLNERLKEANRLNSNNQVLIAQRLGLVERIKRLFDK